jgi:hypothetical protein
MDFVYDTVVQTFDMIERDHQWSGFGAAPAIFKKKYGNVLADASMYLAQNGLEVYKDVRLT